MSEPDEQHELQIIGVGRPLQYAGSLQEQRATTAPIKDPAADPWLPASV